MSNEIIKLLSSDNIEHSVERCIAERSVIIRDILVDVAGDDFDLAVPLPNVKSHILAKIIEWCTHHKDDPLTSPDEDDDVDKTRKQNTDISEWDVGFMDGLDDMEMTFDIILAANYLDIKPLLDVGCKTVANMIKGRSVEQVREIFGIVNDFTPEEEERIRKENEWAEDR